MWPTRPGEAVGTLRAVVLIALGTALMALSAKVNLPLPYVPMTLQTLVVLMSAPPMAGALAAQP